MSTLKTKLEHRIASASTVGELFAHAFRFAVAHLEGADVARLVTGPTGDLLALGWTRGERVLDAKKHLDGLALRGPRHRLRFRKPERQRLSELLDDGTIHPARLAFLLAAIVDERFSSVEPRVTPNDRLVSALPAAFYGEVSNPPPQLGQMTPIAACRRWMRGFWYVGRVQSLEGFGALPEPRYLGLPSRTQQALEGAVANGELRLAAASWRRHAAVDLLELPARAGCFAIGGCKMEPSAAELDAVLRAVRAARPHVVVFPELSFSDTGFEHLRAWLRTNAGRFPVLTVVGRAHRAKPPGGYENLGVVLDGTGEVVLSHEKLEPYQLPDGRIEDLLPRASDRYEVLDTPVGRLVVNVCKDVRSDVPMLLNRMVGASLLLVPAYSSRLDFALEEARVLGARQRAIVLAANAAAGLAHATALYLPLKGSKFSVAVPQTSHGSGTVQTFTLRVGPGSVGDFHAAAGVAV